jgi:hypothetical protein
MTYQDPCEKMIVGAINALVKWVSLVLAKSESEAKIIIQKIVDFDFCSRNENLQNKFCLKCILHLLKSQPNTSTFFENVFYA